MVIFFIFVAAAACGVVFYAILRMCKTMMYGYKLSLVCAFELINTICSISVSVCDLHHYIMSCGSFIMPKI